MYNDLHMKIIKSVLGDMGFGLSAVDVHGTMQFIAEGRPGKTDEYGGVDLLPLMTSIVFMDKARQLPLMQFYVRPGVDGYTQNSLRMENLSVPSAVDLMEAERLLQFYLLEYASLTGGRENIWRQSESRPDMIAESLSKKIDLVIPLDILIRSIELDDLLFDIIVKSKTPEKDKAIAKIHFEKFSLKYATRQCPCTFELFKTLMNEYRSGNFQGIGFDGFYSWFRTSEKKLNGDELSDESKSLLDRAVKQWLSEANDGSGDEFDERTPEWIESKQHLAMRVLKAHPLHEKIVGDFVEAKIKFLISGLNNQSIEAPVFIPERLR